jgi:DNA processing protein
MPHDGELAAWLRLTLVPGLGGPGLRNLLSEFGLPSQVFGAPRAALSRSPGPHSRATRR